MCTHRRTINTADDTEEAKHCDVQSVEWEGAGCREIKGREGREWDWDWNCRDRQSHVATPSDDGLHRVH